jgi:hypothetical protein
MSQSWFYLTTALYVSGVTITRLQEDKTKQTRCSYTWLNHKRSIFSSSSCSDGLYSPIVKKLQKYTDLKEELTRIWQLNAICIVPLVLSTSIIPCQICNSLKLLHLYPGLYIPTQKAVILDICCIIWSFLSELWIISAWSVTHTLWKPDNLLWLQNYYYYHHHHHTYVHIT